MGEGENKRASFVHSEGIIPLRGHDVDEEGAKVIHYRGENFLQRRHFVSDFARLTLVLASTETVGRFACFLDRFWRQASRILRDIFNRFSGELRNNQTLRLLILKKFKEREREKVDHLAKRFTSNFSSIERSFLFLFGQT